MPLITAADPSPRSQPWLTYLLAVALIAAFWGQRMEGASLAKRSAASIASATEYFEQNPTVALDPRFEMVLGVEWVETVRVAYVDKLRSKDRPLLSGFLQRRQQEKFDELEQIALVDLDRLPIFRHGVLGKDTPSQNYATHVFIAESGFYLGVAIFFLVAAGAALEFSWGMLLLSLLSVVSVGVAAGVAATLHQDLSAPWVGTTGLVAGLLGASLFTTLRRPPLLLGAVPLPGWLLLPAFAATELSKNGGMPPLDSALLLAPAAAAAAGLCFALLVGLLKPGPNARRSRGAAPNAAIEKAKRALASRQPDRAIELLQKEFARRPGDSAVGQCLWEAEREHGDPTRAGDAMLTVVRDHVRRGRSAEVVLSWLELVGELPGQVAEAPLMVRVAQALLDEGQADEALRLLTAALDDPEPLPSALLLRVIRVARDLDAPLAQRAAELALAKPDLGNSDRADLQKLLAAPAEPPPAEPLPAEPRNAEPPAEGPKTDDLGNPLPRIKIVQKPASQIAREPIESPEPWETGGVEDLSSELADDPAAAPAAEPHAAREVVASSWSDQSSEAATVAVNAIDDPSTIDPHAIALDSLSDDVSEGASASDEDMQRWNDPSLIDAEGDDLAADTQGVDQPARPVAAPQTETEQAFNELGDARQLKLVSALPVSLDEAGLALEIEGRGKIALAYDKIDALAAAAVCDLGPKPVLVIDLVLNWMSLRQESLRVIRFRSDQFDPRKLVPGASSATEALRGLLSAIMKASDATPLPDADAASGTPFAQFADLTAYEQQVLMVDSSRYASPS